MRILFVSSECAPFSKSGGLADVAFSLPPALREAGNKIAVITPMYQCVKERFGHELKKEKELWVHMFGRDVYCGLWRGENHGVTVWFVDNEEFFLREKLYGYGDDDRRFAWFCRAVIAALPELDFLPEILHCNDWETALAVIYLKNDQVTNPALRDIRSVYTIHNIAYQGQFGGWELENIFELPEGWYDGGLGYEFEGRRDVNLMKGAMLMADAVSTVSPTYARELHHPQFGMGLQGVADMVENKLFGILNGIDMELYDPSRDSRLPYAFDRDHMAGKDKCKAAIQAKFGLELEPRFPLLCSVARLVEQKGIELIREILPALMELGVQLIIFGQGDQSYVDYFEDCARRWPGQLGFSSAYSEQVAAEVFAGADFYLMPSRFEPCGLSQMMAMRYGTVPIVHETGGLKDSVRPYSEFDGIGDGFSFSAYQSKDLLLAIRNALRVYFCDEETFSLLRRRDMEKDFSWTRSAQQYNRMYAEISSGSHGEKLPFGEAFQVLRQAYLELDEENRGKYRGIFTPGYHRAIEIHVVGQSEGILYVRFSRDGEGDKFEVMPYGYFGADAYVTANYEHLLAMAKGQVSFDKLYLSGQLKVEGNLSKGTEIRNLLCRH